jgi:CHAT domain-containing protein/tetratricopeptide (TPR) repeat protein
MGCLSLNGSHGTSISRGRSARRSGSGFRFGARGLLVVLPILGLLTPVSGSASCADALAHPAFTAGPLTTLGTTPATTSLALAPVRTYLIEVEERDNDALVELLDSSGQMLARADHPERRSGTRRAIVSVPQTGSITLRVTGKEHANATGTATARAYDLGSISSPECVAVFNDLAAADASYAVGQDISSGRVPAAGRSAHDAYLRAAEGYTAGEVALTATGDRQMRGATELALAALNLLDLTDWTKTADWARKAATTLEGDDAYRHARAEALLAEAWLQMGRSETVEQAASLLSKTRGVQQRLSRFHLQRGETYDAALQVNNVALTYLYQGRYSECVTAAAAATRLFGSIHEAARGAQAWQNRALCLWGLGRLSEARDGFERALGEMGPQASPRIYLTIVTNTALLDYSVGNYDESLRIYDRALGTAEATQLELDAARCLYGIGVNYRALGDPERARNFLERSLSVRTVALDGRGRMDTLRALASVDAEQGRLQEAVDFDREALTLAADPLASEGIRVQLASHIAPAGQPEEGKALLDEVLSKGPRGDPIILAQALVQRAVILRSMGRSQDALGDLARALRRFHALGSVNGEFATNLELARTLRLAGRTREALAAVERALAQGDTVRLQSVNPDFRTQLEAPLRAVYDLKIELLHTEFDAAVAAGRPAQAAALAASAFAAADSSRARTFSDVAAQEYSPGLRRALAPELRRREAIYRKLAERRFALDSLTDLSPVSNPRARHLLSDIAELKRQTDTVNTAIAARAAHPAGPKAGGMRGRVPSVPADSALVSFWLGAESSYAWVVLPEGIHWVRLAAPALIAERAGALHDSLTRVVDRPVEQRLAHAARLSELVIKPLEPWLTRAGRWIIVPDGALDYIPFAALRLTGNPESYVVLHHDVALTPAAWMLNTVAATSRRPDERALLLVADPVYQPDDPRLAAVPKLAAAQSPGADRSPDSAGYHRLAYTAQEAATVRREFLPAEVDELIGLDATRDRLLSADLSRYRFIHIATHGSVDTRVPELSALVLGSYDARGNLVDGAVRVPDLTLQTLHAEVAVFSACDTALGKQVASEGLVGIGSTVLARGARAVVASLWPVSDEMGARLMTEFYRHLLRDSMSAPAALAAAMRTVVSREGAADPALWAAFQVSVVALGPGRPSRNGGSKVSTTSAEGGTL